MRNILRNKKGMTTQVVIMISILAGLLTIMSFSGVINVASIVGSGSYIERPVFYYDKCEAIGSYGYSTPYNIATAGSWLDKPSVSSSYDVTINTPASLGTIGSGNVAVAGHRIEYYVCNSKVLSEDNCRVYSKKVLSGTPVINNVRDNEVVWIQYQKLSFFKWKEDSGAKYQLGFVPYGIRQYNVLGGSGNIVSSGSCTYSSSQRDTILLTNAEKVSAEYSGVDKSTNQRVLQAEEVRWYVAGYLTSAEPSFALKYNNKDAWCRPTGSGAEIYEINKIETSGGTYKIASADWSDYLGSENCCPSQVRGDEVCNDRFKWEKVQGSECGAFKSCGSSDWVPFSEEKIVKYSCVQGYCEKETKEVECASNFDCIDSNEICDTNTWKCVQANVNLDGQVIETLPDSPAECSEKGGTWITKESEDRSLLNVFGIGKPKVIIEEYCDMGGMKAWLKWLLIAGGVLLLIFLWKPLWAGLRAILGKLGVKI